MIGAGAVFVETELARVFAPREHEAIIDRAFSNNAHLLIVHVMINRGLAEGIIAKLINVGCAFGRGPARLGEISVVQVTVVHSLIITNFVLTAVVNRLAMCNGAVLIEWVWIVTVVDQRILAIELMYLVAVI